jgi:hypothetical protein
LEKERLIQALGLSFSVSTLALAAGLAGRGAFQLTAAGASLLCTVPALAGVVVGQWIRDKLNAVYCGPVLRHPAGPIQAANFRSAIAF